MKTRPANTTPDGELACAFGEPWMGPHPLCQAEVARVCGVNISEVLLPDWSRYAIEPTQLMLFAEKDLV